MDEPADSTDGPRTTLEVRSHEDVLAAVPVVLGFLPQDSVVMLTFGGIETFHARLDLPSLDDVDDAVAMLLGPARRYAVSQVVFVVYAADGRPSRRLIRRLRVAFATAGIDVLDVLRVHDGRWYAPGAPDAPPGGTPFDVDDHRFRAQAVVQGIVVQGSRDEVRALLRPLPLAVAETARVLSRCPVGSADEVGDLVTARLQRGRFTTVELARVLLALRATEGREAALRSMSRERADDQVRLWTDAVQRAPDELVATPAAVLALAAWLAGRGALSWCAVDRSQEVDPDNSLARLVSDLLTCAVPPSAWAQAAQAG